MEYYSKKRSTGSFRIEKFPDAAKTFGNGFPHAYKVFGLQGPKSRRFSDMVLHKADLDFAIETLDAINSAPPEPRVVREAMWRSAVVHFMKCFGQSESRSSLLAKNVYKAETRGLEAFAYFESLRNKHIVHDENSYMQCLPGAILNKVGIRPKIAKVVFVSIAGETLTQENFNNLHVLATRARDWVAREIDKVSDSISAELELRRYDDLSCREGLLCPGINANDVHRSRERR